MWMEFQTKTSAIPKRTGLDDKKTFKKSVDHTHVASNQLKINDISCLEKAFGKGHFEVPTLQTGDDSFFFYKNSGTLCGKHHSQAYCNRGNLKLLTYSHIPSTWLS